VLSGLLVTLGIVSYLIALSLFYSKSVTADKSELTINKASADVFDKVQSRGYVRCGVASNRPGYSTQVSTNFVPNELLKAEDQNKEYYEDAVGIEADLCRAIAIGLFGELKSRVYFKNFDGGWNSRMEVIEKETADVLFRGTGMVRELGLTHYVDFLPVVYLEPMVVLVRNNVAKTTELLPDEMTACTISGTFSDFAAQWFVRTNNKRWRFPDQANPKIKYKNYAEMLKAYQTDQCDGMVGRYSAIRAIYENHNLAQDHNRILLGDAYYTPVSGVVKAAQWRWKNVVTQSIWTLIKAQAQGYSNESVPPRFNSKAWSLMELDQSNPVMIVKLLGHYGQLYRRNLDEDLPGPGPNQHFLSNPSGRLLVPF